MDVYATLSDERRARVDEVLKASGGEGEAIRKRILLRSVRTAIICGIVGALLGFVFVAALAVAFKGQACGEAPCGANDMAEVSLFGLFLGSLIGGIFSYEGYRPDREYPLAWIVEDVARRMAWGALRDGAAITAREAEAAADPRFCAAYAKERVRYEAAREAGSRLEADLARRVDRTAAFSMPSCD